MRYELTDYEWAAIRPMLPNKPRGVPRVNDRRVLNGIFWVLRSGAPWRDLPESSGPYTTCYPNLPPSKTPFMHKQTYRRLTNQLRQLEARSPDQRRRKRKAKPLSHTAQRPATMYRTQVTSIALA
jgi:transposase